MDHLITDVIAVPGASLFYQIRGQGPLLLMIAGGGGDAGSFDRLARYLVDHFTLVTYDRRGYARSPLVDPGQPVGIETHSDDAQRLIAHLSSAPVAVLGCSIGALIGLDLVLRHPERVRRLIAHEPPLTQLLDSPDEHPPLLEMYHNAGASAALDQFAASIGVRRGEILPNGAGAPSRLSSAEREPAAALRGNEQNMEAFFRYDAQAVTRYTLDIAALQAVSSRVVVAGGSEGPEYFPYRCAARLAECLGTKLVEFPGTHAGFVEHPAQFAKKVIRVLKD